MRLRVFLAVLFLLSLPAFPAVISTYQTNALWQGATTSFQTIDFEYLATQASSWGGGFGPYVSGNTFNAGDVTITPSTGFLQYVNSSTSPYWNYGTDITLMLTVGSSGFPAFHLALPTGITSIAANLMTGSPATSGFQVTVANNVYTVATQAQPIPGFFGATFDAPITSVDFTALGPAGSYAFLDNIQFGTAATTEAAPDPNTDTPEIASLLMIGSGLIVFRFTGRKFLHSA